MVAPEGAPEAIRMRQMTHPDSDVLAEFRAGLVTGRRGARISAHLVTCERCADLCGQLTEISTLLAAVPAPAMPDAVVLRLESVLAAEAAQRQDSSERAVDDSAPDRVAGPPRRGWDFRLVALRVLAPAAAVVLLAAGGYSLSRITSSPTTSGPAASAASAAASTHARPVVAAPSTAESRPGGSPAFEGPAKFAVVTSATNYYRATLAQQLERELRRYARTTTGSTQEYGLLRGCVRRVTTGTYPGTLLLVEKAYYRGDPAIVIVARSGQRDAAWVTTPACSATSDHVLAMTTLPGTSAL
jgi:hypothetical protein